MEPLRYLEGFGVVVCTACRQHAIVPSQVEQHLKGHHHDLPKPRREEIREAVLALPTIYKTPTDLLGFQYPITPIPAIPELAAPQSAYRCRHCRRVLTDISRMQRHCKDEHGWTNPRGRGGDVALKATISYDFPWDAGAFCQRFFRSRYGARLFEVLPPEASAPAARTMHDSSGSDPVLVSDDTLARTLVQHSRPSSPPSMSHPLGGFISHLHGCLVHAGSDSVITEGDDKMEPNAWLSRTGWARHLSGWDKDFVFQAAGLDATQGWDVNEGSKWLYDLEVAQDVLQRLWDSVGRTVQLAHESCSYPYVGVSILKELRRFSVDEKVVKPFNPRLEPATVVRYASTWKRIVGWVVRTFDLPNDRAPPYQLTSLQRETLRSLLGILSPRQCSRAPHSHDPEPLDRLTLLFLLALVDHPLHGDSYESPLLSGLAAIGVRQEGGWHRPETYTTHYSAVIRVARGVVLRSAQQGLEDAPPAADRGTYYGLFSVVRDQVGRILTLVHKDSLPHPIDWVITTRAYGLKVRYTTPVTGRVVWQGDQVSYGDIQFTLWQLKEMLRILCLELEDLMGELTFAKSFAEEHLPAVDWDRLHDNPSNDAVGFCFLDDPRNDWMRPQDSLLFRQVERDPQLRKTWETDEGQLETKVATQYFRNVDRFRELLLVAIHLLGGQPARTTELIGLRHRNTAHGGIRNILIENGMVSLVFFYHKGLNTSGQVRVIYRYLPRPLGDLLVRYLWLVLPFAAICRVAQLLPPAPARSERKSYATSDFLWSNTLVYRQRAERDLDLVWRPDKLRRIFQSHTARLLAGNRVVISAWRQIAISIARRFLDPEMPLDGDDAGGGIWDDSDSEAGDLVVRIPDSILDRQAGHSSRTAQVNYGREVWQGKIGTAYEQEQYRRTSVLWHRLLGRGDPSDTAARVRLPSAQMDKGLHLARRQRLKALRRTDLDGRLRHMLRDSKARFRGNQREAIDAIIAGASPVVHITGTGSGKTVTFLLPAFCSPASKTVVVVPFIALQQDIERRCQEAGIRCQVWDPFRPCDAALILVTPEAFGSGEFSHFLNILLDQHALDRIVLDECHTILDSSYDFRPQLMGIGHKMLRYPVQLVFLTATLPLREEATFLGALQIRPETARIVRGLTSRPNISYSVVRLESHDEDVSRINDFIGQLPAQPEGYEGRPKVVIYCQRRYRVTTLAAQLGCDFYHGELASRADRKRVVERWRDQGGPIVATSALGAGLDVPDVRLVVHAGKPRSLRDFVQESGRAGRDGQPAQSVILLGGNPDRQRQALHHHLGNAEKEDISEFVADEAICRRTILSRVMDGRMDRTSCEDGEAGCDLCSRRAQLSYEKKVDDGGFSDLDDSVFEALERQMDLDADRVMATRQRTAEEVQRFEVYLEAYASAHCFGCFEIVRQKAPYYAHPTCYGYRDGAEKRIQTNFWDGWVEPLDGFQAMIRSAGGLAPYSACFHCWLPQAVCPSWEATSADGGSFVRKRGGECSYDPFFQRALRVFCKTGNRNPRVRFVGWRDRAFQRAIDAVRALSIRFEFDNTAARPGPGVEDLVRLYRTKIRWGGVEAMGGCLLFLYYCDTSREYISAIR